MSSGLHLRPTATRAHLGLCLGVVGLLGPCFACDTDEPAAAHGPAATQPCHERMALLPGLGVCVDRFEARIEGSGASARALSAEGLLPAASASWQDADAACKGAGLRLCTAAEWGRACGGTEGRAYPYGEEYEVGRCNTAQWDSDLSSKALAPGGSFTRCVTPEGIYDLSGNIGEWVSDADATGLLRELRGGAYANMGKYVRCGWDPPSYQPPEQRYVGQGFRCCVDARR